jgi:hypothetical protein
MLRGELRPQLISGEKGAVGALQEQGLQRDPIGLGIGILLSEQIKALLHHSTHGRETATVDQRSGKGVLVAAEGNGTLDHHAISIRTV